jgi:hypothetical protein
MEVTDFLKALSVDELKDLAWQMDLLRGGNKPELIARIETKVSNPFEVLPLLNNVTLKGFCRGSGLRIADTKDELVASLIHARVIEGDEANLCGFITGGGLPDLALCLDLAKTLRNASSVPRIAWFLRYCDDRQVKTLARQMTKMDREAAVATFVSLLVSGSKEEVRSASIALEVSMEAEGRSDRVQRALSAHREELRARRRKIESAVGPTWKAAPQVHEILLAVWRVEDKPPRAKSAKGVGSTVDGLAARVEAIQRREAEKERAEAKHQGLVQEGIKELKASTTQIRERIERYDTRAIEEKLASAPRREDVAAGFTEVKASTARIQERVDLIDTQRIEKQLAGAPKREDLTGGFGDLNATTRRIDERTERMEAGLNHMSAEMAGIRREVENSPQRVVEALQQLAASKDIKLTKRLRIKRDLGKVSKILDAAQKAEFLTRVIQGYGPIVAAALSALLKGSG